ncbi:MAG: amidohydrolase family protein [Acidimicrobiales bacterium]
MIAAERRSGLGHPVIDADGHWVEYGPVLRDAMARIGGEAAARGFASFGAGVDRALTMTVAQRRQANLSQEGFWGSPTRNTLDRATSMLPRLLHERLDEFGIDFAVLYPTSGLGTVRIVDDGDRRATCAAFNTYSAETFAPYTARMTPAAVIPMHTPEEALAELDHVVELGLKAVMMGSLMARPLGDLADRDPELARRFGWLDALGLDSAHDYDPVWARCVELGLAPTFHTGSRRYGLRTSPSNFVYNHIGHFAAASEAVCKALFLGGVTRRFPALRVAFLEGGVGWACQLYSDLVGHWEKRNLEALEATRPDNLNVEELLRLAAAYGEPDMAAALSGRAERLANPPMDLVGGIDNLDDFHRCQINEAADIAGLFTTNFFFGCEADDPTNALAFNRRQNPFGAQLGAIFGSDIGHFDVLDMAEVLPEAYELVEHGLMDLDDFRCFVFENPARLWAEANPRFFEGTAVEGAVRELMAARQAPMVAAG